MDILNFITMSSTKVSVGKLLLPVILPMLGGLLVLVIGLILGYKNVQKEIEITSNLKVQNDSIETALAQLGE